MPLEARKEYQVPDFWTVYGHSFMNYSFGTYFQTGRSDSLFRASLDIETVNWHNFAVSGARITTEGSSTGGYERILKRTNRPQRGGPYVSEGGAMVLCYGINDMGVTGVTTQIRTGFIHAMRTALSIWRASVIYENNFQVGTRTSYGAGFGEIAPVAYTTNNSVHWCIDGTPDADDFFTLTLPADYDGEPIGILLVGAGGAAAGTVTWSGTAGVTGTTNTSDVMPSAAATHCPIIKRVTGLTSANAGDTIVGTVTAMDSGGAVMFDCWWLESKVPPPVVVCNISKLTATGYTNSYPGWAGTESSRDDDVDTWNADLRALVSEFDSMVQIADIDSALAKIWYSSDGLHPDERGAARIADAIRSAMRRLTPTSDSPTQNLNPSAPRAGGILRPHISGRWYTADYTVASAATPVAEDLWAIPFWITNARDRMTQFAMQLAATDNVSPSTIRWGVYEDIAWDGYPKDLVTELTAAGAFSVTGTAGPKFSPTSGTGSINHYMDPGLYWLAMKVITVGQAHTFRVIQGPNFVMPNVQTNGNAYTTTASIPSGFRLTGQGTGALPNTFPTGAVATASAPYIGVKIEINPMNV
jgi:hypothetical protein